MSKLNHSFEGKIALVTGGSVGMGKAYAVGFAKAGADVAICSSTGNALKSTADEIESLGGRALAIKADVSCATDVDRMVQEVISQFGHIDVLINNAAIAVRGMLFNTEEDVWDKVINTNLKGCYLCCKAVAKSMIEQKSGSIINVASTMGFKALPDRTAYSVSKAGVLMLTRVLARELGSSNVRVNAIAPGTFKTRMNEAWLADTEATQAVLTNIPLGRIAEPEDVVGAALFLASDDASWITGNTIVVDGGFLA